jgi:hypothetical protein
MRRLVPLVVAPLTLFLAACGAETPGAGGAGTTGEPPPAVSEPDPAQLYEANTTVLENKTHGPMLCLGGVLMSLPPQCGDVPMAGWDWSAVEGEKTVSGTTSGSYHLVGRYDGETFTATTVGPYEKGFTPDEDPDFSSPCPDPEGGWPGLEHASQEEAHRVAVYARSQPDYAAMWVTPLEPAKYEFSPVVVNVVFTGEPDRHEAEIRKVWDGPLCVVARDVPTARELAGIRKEAEASLDELGLQMLWSAGPDVEPVIEIGVVADLGGKGQAAFDARFGPGVVRVIPALEPVS